MFFVVFWKTLSFCILQVSYTIANTDDYAYFWPSFPLTWFEAETYCKTHCNSDLGTIRYSNQTAFIVDIFPDFDINTAGIWIGLHKSNRNGSYAWIDDTNNTSYDYDSSTWTHDCIYLSVTDTQLYDASCTNIYAFVCNSCHNVIHKYALAPKDDISHVVATNYCEDQYHTSLASIHSQSDYEKAINLCQIYGNYSCWIGLHYTEEDDVWEWLDGTTFDFGSNMGEYPWNNTLTDEQHCVYIYIDGLQWLWNAAECDDDAITSYPLCNMPSELCNEPHIVYGNEESIHFACDDHYIRDDGYNMMLLDGEEWLNSETLNIEFMFTISTINSNDTGDGGIMLRKSAGCFYFYIGVSITASETKLFMKFMSNGIYIDVDNAMIPSNISSDYYLLQISVSLDGSYIKEVNVSLGNLISLSHHVGDFLIRYGYIGMITHNVEMNGTYLYVSGSKQMNDIDVNGFSDCGFADIEEAEEDSDSEEQMEYLTDGQITGIIIICVCLCICCTIAIYMCRKTELRQTKAKTAQETKQKVEQETKKEIEERERQYTELQQKSAEKILELEEQVKKLQEELIPFEVMEAVVQPGSLPKNVFGANDVQYEESATATATVTHIEGAEGVSVNVNETDCYEKKKMTKMDSAVRLDIPQAAYTNNKNIYTTNDGGNTGEDEKGVMDEMLADVLKMKDTDTDKVHAMDGNDVVNKTDNDMDSDSDNMYDKADSDADDHDESGTNASDIEENKLKENDDQGNTMSMNSDNENNDTDSGHGNSDDMYDRNDDEEKDALNE